MFNKVNFGEKLKNAEKIKNFHRKK